MTHRTVIRPRPGSLHHRTCVHRADRRVKDGQGIESTASLRPHAGGRPGTSVMGHLVPPRHRQPALGAALVATVVVLLPATARGDLLPTTTTNLTTSLPTVSVPTVSVPTVSVPTVSVPTLPTATVPSTTVTVPSVTVPGTTTTTPSATATTPSSGDLQGTVQNLPAAVEGRPASRCPRAAAGF